VPGAGEMEAWLRVNVRIDVRAWAQRQVRIYLVLPQDEAASVEALWTTQGRLLGGQLRSGERSLVYAGSLQQPALEDQMQLRLRSPAHWQGRLRRLAFHFELEAD
jgi:hypothetical protein